MCVCARAAVYVCKLADGEQPLFLRLLAGPDTDTLSFVLREQQTGEVMVTSTRVQKEETEFYKNTLHEYFSVRQYFLIFK